MAFPGVIATLSKPAAATQYSLGDIIANSVTAGSVVPITFPLSKSLDCSGKLTGARCVLTAASGTVVLPKFDLLLFRPVTSIPFAAAGYPADNAALNVSAAAMKELVAVFAFSDTGWRNQAGGATAAGLQVHQAVGLAGGRLAATFNLGNLNADSLVGVLQAQNTWDPGNVANTFDFALDVE